MNRNEAEALLKQACEKYGVNYNDVFQFGCARGAAKEAYKYHASHMDRLDSHLFAIKYFPCENIYVAWNLWEGKRKTDNFSISRSKVNIIPGKIAKIPANVEYPSWDTRIVYAFEPACLDEFVRRYVARKNQKI